MAVAGRPRRPRSPRWRRAGRRCACDCSRGHWTDASTMDGVVADHRNGRAGEGTPVLELDGYNGPLDQLLVLARAHEIDLTRLPLVAFVDQLVAALHHAPPATPLGQKGDWVVMTAWLVQLRSRLLLPADVQPQAEAQAVELRERLVDLQAMQALARWLDGRPQLGRDVFARGRPEDFAAALVAEPDRGPIEHVRWGPSEANLRRCQPAGLASVRIAT